MPSVSPRGSVDDGTADWRSPRSAPYRIAASSTDRHNGPMWSSVALSGTTPSVDRSPKAGFRPTSPQTADGIRIEPPVSVPSDAKHIPSATAAAEPPDEPPGLRLVSIG